MDQVSAITSGQHDQIPALFCDKVFTVTKPEIPVPNDIRVNLNRISSDHHELKSLKDSAVNDIASVLKHRFSHPF